MENEHEERWLPVVGFEGWYEISDWGRLKRAMSGKGTFVGRILCGGLDKDGYRYTSLSIDGIAHKVKIHRLVMAAFVGPCPEGKEVNHKDGDKTNNYVENLEYITHRENNIHALNTGLRTSPRGEAHCHSKVTEKDVHEIRRSHGEKSNKEIAERFGITKPAVCHIVSRRNWGWLKEEDNDEQT